MRLAVMPFGKHAGRRLRDVAAEDPAYLDWLLDQDWMQRGKPGLCILIRLARRSAAASGEDRDGPDLIDHGDP